MKLSFEEFEELSQREGYGYFSLKNDNDSCECRILYETLNDLDPVSVHQVKTVDGKYVYVDCLRSKDEPEDLCPICKKTGKKAELCVFIPVKRYSVTSHMMDANKNLKYDSDGNPVYETSEKDDVVMWKRGYYFVKNTLYPLMIEKGKPFCCNRFTVIRHGKAGEQETKYELVFDGADDTVLDDFEGIPTTSDVVLSKTFEELERFNRTGSFDENAPDIAETERNYSNRSVAGSDGYSGGIARRRGSKPNID
jgi:hypothetical protein